MWKSSPGGFSLTELIVTMGILGVLMTLAFGAFAFTTRVFADTNTRQSTETEMRNIKVLLERDLELTNFWQVNTQARTLPHGTRDGLAFVSLSDWTASGNFLAATGRPAWDRYVVWYSTQDNPSGSLYRQLLAPGLPPGGHLNSFYSDLSSNLSDSNPDGNKDVIYSRRLSQSVVDFEVTPKLTNGTVEVRIRLLAKGGMRPQSGGVRTAENLETKITFQPRNTWPAI